MCWTYYTQTICTTCRAIQAGACTLINHRDPACEEPCAKPWAEGKPGEKPKLGHVDAAQCSFCTRISQPVFLEEKSGQEDFVRDELERTRGVFAKRKEEKRRRRREKRGRRKMGRTEGAGDEGKDHGNDQGQDHSHERSTEVLERDERRDRDAELDESDNDPEFDDGFPHSPQTPGHAAPDRYFGDSDEDSAGGESAE